MSYYDILNVSKDASQEEIKQSYKKLILKHHPDKGGNQETFHKIQEAYETLGNSEKRMIYDRPPMKNININFNGHFMNIFQQFNKPLVHIKIYTTFEELYTIYSKEIEIETTIINYPNYKRKIQLNSESKNYLITNEITLPDEFQIINEYDLLLIKKITFYESLNGTIFTLELPNEIINLKKTPIIKDQDIFSIPNKGLLKNHNDRGNLLIKFVLIYPTLDEEKLNILKSIV